LTGAKPVRFPVSLDTAPSKVETTPPIGLTKNKSRENGKFSELEKVHLRTTLRPRNCT
jgi:hypothetical protein